MMKISYFFLGVSILCFVLALFLALTGYARQTTTLEPYVPGTYMPPYQPCKEAK